MTQKISLALKKMPAAYSMQKKMRKRAIYIKLDENIIEWFKLSGAGYQARINQVLSSFVEQMQGQVDLNSVSAETPAVSSKLILAQELFEKFYTKCFWHMRPDLIITERSLPEVIRNLKLHGGRAGFIEAQKLCQ